jgi:membrane-bound ClpP family serine protease
MINSTLFWAELKGQRIYFMNDQTETTVFNRQWSARIIGRYVLFQIPALLIIGTVLILLDHWLDLDFLLILLILLVWIVKDIVLFPFVWKAYDTKVPEPEESMIGQKGVCISDLTPSGYVQIRGELWSAEIADGHEPVKKGESIVVLNKEGLRLRVIKASPGPADSAIENN